MRPFSLARVPGRGTINLSKGAAKQLTQRERRYIRNRWGPARMNQTDAYLDAVRKPDGSYPCSRATAHVSANRMEKRLRERPVLWQTILAAVELDDYTLGGALNWALQATKTEFYQGQRVAEVEDNGTRMQAIQLLTEILGHRKNAVELTGRVDFGAAIAQIAAKVQARQAAEQDPDQSEENGAGGDGS